MSSSDEWSRWLLETRFGGNAEAAERGMQMLQRVRRRVLERARLTGTQTLLDVGCGDGRIGVGALDHLKDGRVIFSDTSAPLLTQCQRLADEAGVRASIVEQLSALKMRLEGLRDRRYAHQLACARTG